MSSSPRNAERILRRLDWTVIRRLDGLLQGDYRSLSHGHGLDLAELREYQVEDDSRAIDWNVTARMQTPYVRQYLEDREVTAWFLLDLSPSVDLGTVRTRKRDLLIDFVAVLCRLLTRQGNRVGVIIYTGTVDRVVPARTGKRHVLRLVNDLLGMEPLASSPPTDLAVLLGTALRAIRRRSQVFVLSDFFSVPGWDGPLGVLARRHEILAVRLFDPRESELPDMGPVFIQDAETGEQLLLDTHDRGFRRRFAEAARRRETGLGEIFARRGVDVLSLSTEGDLVEEVVKFVARRKQRAATGLARRGSRLPAGFGDGGFHGLSLG